MTRWRFTTCGSRRASSVTFGTGIGTDLLHEVSIRLLPDPSRWRQDFTCETCAGYEPAMTRRRFPVLLAALLLLQWGAAYGQCHALRVAAAVLPGWVVCVSHDAADPQAGQDLYADLDCPACHAVPSLVGAPVPALPSVALAWDALVFVPQPDAPGALGARAPPPPARGPPAVQ